MGKDLQRSTYTVSVVNIAFFMIFAASDPSPLTVCINCSLLHLYYYYYYYFER